MWLLSSESPNCFLLTIILRRCSMQDRKYVLVSMQFLFEPFIGDCVALIAFSEYNHPPMLSPRLRVAIKHFKQHFI